MADVFTEKKRSWIMSRVHAKDTRPELLVRSLIHRMGFRYALHKKDLPGNPDIVLSCRKKIIFVHGCFWHGHMHCRRAGRPSTRQVFWNKKLDENISRDKENKRRLKDKGWKVLVIWQCETRSLEKLKRKLEGFLYEGKNNKAPVYGRKGYSKGN